MFAHFLSFAWRRIWRETSKRRFGYNRIAAPSAKNWLGAPDTTGQRVLVNETMVKRLGLSSPAQIIGKRMRIKDAELRQCKSHQIPRRILTRSANGKRHKLLSINLVAASRSIGKRRQRCLPKQFTG
jgi:hypothetical protein